MEHELKCWPEYFEKVLDLSKTFEVRKDDRGYQTGDWLILREWDPVWNRYTGRSVDRRVSFLLRGGAFGIEAGYVVMGLSHGG